MTTTAIHVNDHSRSHTHSTAATMRHTLLTLPFPSCRWRVCRRYKEFTVMSDVWAFGIVLWEICLMGAMPYPGISAMDLVGMIAGPQRYRSPLCLAVHVPPPRM